MSSIEQQIVTQYDTLGMSVDEIAETTELHKGAVETTLLAHSKKYQSEKSGVSQEVGFGNADEELALSVIRRVAQYSEEDGTALKAAMYIRNDKKGRLDPKSAVKRLNLNVQQLNIHFQQAAEALKRVVQPTKVIDVQSTSTN